MMMMKSAGQRLTKSHKKHKISLVPQEDVFFPNLTVREQLSFTALLRFQISILSDKQCDGRINHNGKKGVSVIHKTEETSIYSLRIQNILTSLIPLLSMEKVNWINMTLFQHNLLVLSMIICLQFADTQFQLLSGGEKKRCRFL
jgi:ABC-type sugar transport system ATPase subunit